jgi:hypothetical protein
MAADPEPFLTTQKDASGSDEQTADRSTSDQS